MVNGLKWDSLRSIAFLTLFPDHYLCSKRTRAPGIQLGGLGERCKLPQWGLGQSPSGQRFWCYLST